MKFRLAVLEQSNCLHVAGMIRKLHPHVIRTQWIRKTIESCWAIIPTSRMAYLSKLSHQDTTSANVAGLLSGDSLSIRSRITSRHPQRSVSPAVHQAKVHEVSR